MRPVSDKTEKDIAMEWDNVAQLRAKQVEGGEDLSYHYVLLPYILKFCKQVSPNTVLDVGCGTGFLTERISEIASTVVAVDLSGESLRVARNRLGSDVCVTFVQSSIEEYAAREAGKSFDLVVANMSLMTTPSLDGMINAIARLVRPGGYFIFTVTHPWFWPFYWGYANESWFEYGKELMIEAPFKISLQRENAPITTHVHRPLERYITALIGAGLVIDAINELKPAPDVEKKYPRPWDFPRFLGGKCVQPYLSNKTD